MIYLISCIFLVFLVLHLLNVFLINKNVLLNDKVVGKGITKKKEFQQK